jgi:hypothetical protein
MEEQVKITIFAKYEVFMAGKIHPEDEGGKVL